MHDDHRSPLSDTGHSTEDVSRWQLPASLHPANLLRPASNTDSDLLNPDPEDTSHPVIPVSTTRTSPPSSTKTRYGTHSSNETCSLGRAYTPHGTSLWYSERTKHERARRALEEAQEGITRLISTFETEFLPEMSSVASVRVVRLWQYRSRDGGIKGRLTIPDLISEDLYLAIDNHLPHVARDETLRRALVYLGLVARPDDRSGYLPFHQEAVAHIRQAPSLASRGEAKVYQLAVRLQDTLREGADAAPPFEIVDHGKGRNCTQIRNLSLPAPVERAFEAERGQVFIEGDAANLQTWTLDRSGHRRERRQNARQKADRTARLRDVPDRVQNLQRRLNQLPKQRFTRLVKRAKSELAGLARQRKSSTDGHGIPYQSQLRTIADRPKPLYKFTSRTLRLTPAGPSLASLPTEMRRAVFDDYLEVDMSSAQLSLAASSWGDLENLRDFLSSPADTAGLDARQSQGPKQPQSVDADWKSIDRDWWHELTGWLSRELPAHRYNPEQDFEQVKSVLKGFTYGLFFGMKKQNLRTLGTPYADSTDRAEYLESARMMVRLFLGNRSEPKEAVSKIGDALFRHPLVGQLLRKREEILSRIDTQGGIEDCFGRCIETSDERDAKSVLAEYMQNAELRVMLPVGEAVLEDDELRFGLWQHDGVTIKPRRHKPKKYRNTYEKACEALQKGCSALSTQLGVAPIETDLTVDYGSEFLE